MRTNMKRTIIYKVITTLGETNITSYYWGGRHYASPRHIKLDVFKRTSQGAAMFKKLKKAAKELRDAERNFNRIANDYRVMETSFDVDLVDEKNCPYDDKRSLIRY